MTGAPGGRKRLGDLPMALLLAALAGAVDATGFVQGRTLFVSFMSGNSTILGADGARGDLAAAGAALAVIAMFVAGVTAGECLGAAAGSRARPAVLAAEAVLLAGAAASAPSSSLVTPLLAFAMGVQNASVHKAGGIGVALTYVTGTLVNIGRTLAAALRGTGPWRAVPPYAGLWCSLVAGVSIGALAARRSETGTLAATAVAAALLAGVTAVQARGITTGRT